jgi:hypothetical protein
LEFIKGSGSKLLRCQGILLVEVSNLALSMSEICCRFPRIGAFFVAFPFNSVLELSTEDTRVRDLVNFVLLFAFHHDRVRWQGFIKTIVLIGSKTVDMEDEIELQIVR